MSMDELAELRDVRRKRGRPTKFDNIVAAAIIGAVRMGNFFGTACEAAGVDEGTGHRWIRRGEGRDEHAPATPELTEFANKIREARAYAEMNKVMIISAAAQEDWKAAAWWLERTNPAQWGRRDRTQAEIDVKVTVERIEPPQRSGERLVEMARLAAEMGLVPKDVIEVPGVVDATKQLEAGSPE